MSEEDEYRCFIGNLSYNTTDRDLEEAFKKYGDVLDAKVAMDRNTDRSRGFGFVSFKDKRDMEEAIDAMKGADLDGRNITVEKAQARGSGRDRGGGDRGRDRDYGGGGRSSGGGDCYNCGKPGHFSRECPNGGGGGGGRYSSGRDDRYGGGGGGGGRYGPDRGGDRYGGRSRDSDRDGGGDKYSRDRSGPYDRKSSGGYRS